MKSSVHKKSVHTARLFAAILLLSLLVPISTVYADLNPAERAELQALKDNIQDIRAGMARLREVQDAMKKEIQIAKVRIRQSGGSQG